MGGRFYGPSCSFEASGERAGSPRAALRLEVDERLRRASSVLRARTASCRVTLRKVVFLPTEEKAREPSPSGSSSGSRETADV